jgi:3-oxoacyl-[acyl-carrier protein] reductase
MSQALPSPGAETSFKGRVAMVTGAGSGIGRAVARALATRGAAVLVVDFNAGAAETVADELRDLGARSAAAAADVSSSAQVGSAVEAGQRQLGPIDVLVNAAGGFKQRRLLVDTPEEEWDAVVDANLKGVFLCCRAVLPSMIERHYGRIVSISSEAARATTYLTAAHYTAAKAGVLGLTRHLASEVGEHGITVNAVTPGVTAVPRSMDLYDPQRREDMNRQIPVGRWADPDEQANAVLFLASEGAAYVTGVTLPVNGGWPMT